VRVGRINGEFVLNPTVDQLEESELDLVVSGTKDAIMMVEAGAKIISEDVMAEAIMFGHRSLGPIVDLQSQLREQVGKAKRVPYIEPGVDSILEFAKTYAGDHNFVVFDVETTSRDPKQGSMVEIGAVRVGNGQIVDRWSTLVNPGRRSSASSFTASPTRTSRGAPSPSEAPSSSSAGPATRSWWATTSASISPSWRLPLVAAAGSSRASTSTRWCWSARPIPTQT
jgi:hypothetical protein